eukprot:367090-Amphidinium_carterae.1
MESKLHSTANLHGIIIFCSSLSCFERLTSRGNTSRGTIHTEKQRPNAASACWKVPVAFAALAKVMEHFLRSQESKLSHRCCSFGVDDKMRTCPCAAANGTTLCQVANTSSCWQPCLSHCKLTHYLRCTYFVSAYC